MKITEHMILHRIEWNNYPSSPPKSNDEGGRNKKKTPHHFGITEMGGGGDGQDVPFILFQIAILHRIK